MPGVVNFRCWSPFSVVNVVEMTWACVRHFSLPHTGVLIIGRTVIINSVAASSRLLREKCDSVESGLCSRILFSRWQNSGWGGAAARTQYHLSMKLGLLAFVGAPVADQVRERIFGGVGAVDFRNGGP